MTAPEPLWEPAPTDLVLAGDEVHLWCASLELSSARLQSLHELLCADERERADRLVLPRSRAAFVGARGLLRSILGLYLDRPPQELRFCYSPQGKPALADQALCFNLSHSQGLALCAFSRARPVGIDVERLRPQVAGEQIARRFFSPREVEALQQVDPTRRTEAFFACWTRKEAYLKARGQGLSLGLHRFAVSLGEPAALLHSDQGEGECRRWRLCALRPQPGYVGALCAPAGDWQLRCFHL
ncbi:MAG: 4'-phosphopantetheinyl transferase superfamily protein [Candidatus Latescibacteria bacterium]|nr:4'-phosphopantetheinyl transferase superfamily protein [Candidatus Latescibacterota bacterium]